MGPSGCRGVGASMPHSAHLTPPHSSMFVRNGFRFVGLFVFVVIFICLSVYLLWSLVLHVIYDTSVSMHIYLYI